MITNSAETGLPRLQQSSIEAAMNRREFGFGLAAATGSVVLTKPFTTVRGNAPLRVNGARLNEHLKALAEFGKNPQGGVSRVAYSEADRQGREYVMGLMRAAKLDTSIDAAGNIIGRRRESSETKLQPILLGSHIDSVPEGGNYDGDVGSLGAIEVAQTLAENNIYTRHPLEVVIFQNEEGGLIGSEAMIGVLTGKELDHVSSSGKTIREGINFIGGDGSKLASVKREKGSIAAYLELHIEQVGTVGKIQAFPGAPNVIPGKVVLTLELRDLDAAKIQMLYQKMRAEADQIAQASKVTFDFKELNTNIPAPTDSRIRAIIDSSAKELGLTTKQMPSGAGHDAQDMARLGPVGMIFIPSIGGISHSPKELSRQPDIENGGNVLLGVLRKLDITDLSRGGV